MANEILNALLGARYTPTDNGYGMAAQGLSAALPSVVNPYGSTGSNAVNVLGVSILDALLTGMARNQSESQNQNLMGLQTKFLDPNTTADERSQLLHQEDKLSPLAMVLASNAMDLQQKKAEKQQELDLTEPYDIKKEQRGISNDLLKAVGNATIDIQKQGGYVTNPLTGEVTQVLDMNKLAADKAAAEAMAKADTEDLINKKRSSNGLPKITDPKVVAETIKQYDTQISSDPAATAYNEVNTQYEALKNAIKTKDPVAAKAAMYMVAKLTDPSTVREGELKYWQSAGGVKQKFAQYFENLKSGNLTPEMSKGILATANAVIAPRYSTYKDMANSRLSTLGGLIGKTPEETGVKLYSPPVIDLKSMGLDNAPPPGLDLEGFKAWKRAAGL